MLNQIESPCLGLGHIAHDYDTKHQSNEGDQDQVDEKEGLGHSLRRHEAPGGPSGLVTNSDILWMAISQKLSHLIFLFGP